MIYVPGLFVDVSHFELSSLYAVLKFNMIHRNSLYRLWFGTNSNAFVRELWFWSVFCSDIDNKSFLGQVLYGESSFPIVRINLLLLLCLQKYYPLTKQSCLKFILIDWENATSFIKSPKLASYCLLRLIYIDHYYIAHSILTIFQW